MNLFERLLRRPRLTCADVNAFLVEYFDGDLGAEVRRRFEDHLRRCRRCSVYLEQYRTTMELIRVDGGTSPLAIPPELVEHTLAFLRAQAEFSNE